MNVYMTDPFEEPTSPAIPEFFPFRSGAEGLAFHGEGCGVFRPPVGGQCRPEVGAPRRSLSRGTGAILPLRRKQ